ncbi:MAG TPA: S-layer homology domain-containing protein [Nodosilinea sp.]|nr:S-layer homology domain-containing protein [Nodosilinea sp.]
MVNLPPDQPDPRERRQSGGASRDDQRILDFDELLAVVLAFVGIGSILWWGLSRSQGWLTETARLDRRAGESSDLAAPERDSPSGLFEPRRVEPRDRPQRPTASPTPLPNQSFQAAPPQAAAPVPVAPANLPAEPLAEAPQELETTTQPLDISDVPPTHWAYPFIKPMFDGGYLPDFPEQGFQPDQPLTRAELASLLSEAFGDAPREGSARSFSDVDATYWAAPAIDNAVAQGFMSGYPEGTFRPDRAVPRYEVLVTLATGLDLAPSPAPDQTLQAFVDLGPLPGWARPKVAAAAEGAVVVNYPARDRLKPTQAATRAEIVAMIHQALVQQGELPAVESEYTLP